MSQEPQCILPRLILLSLPSSLPPSLTHSLNSIPPSLLPFFPFFRLRVILTSSESVSRASMPHRSPPC
eukprot:898964-Rhodomonas_salina.1